jgi:hypothetical protein
MVYGWGKTPIDFQDENKEKHHLKIRQMIGKQYDKCKPHKFHTLMVNSFFAKSNSILKEF